MGIKSIIIKLIVGIISLVGLVFIYLSIKFYYYQDLVQKEITSYNKAVILYNQEYNNLDSLSKLKIQKINYYYINDSEDFIRNIDLGYKELSELIAEMKTKVVFSIGNIKTFRKNKFNNSSTFSFHEDMNLFIEDTTIDKSLFYSTDEIHELYEESEKKHNEIINQAKKKK